MSAETERVAVKTYVPASQKEQWEEHADRLDMSQSEFVRTMVQSGRRGFLEAPRTESADEGHPEEGSDPATADLEERVQTVLSTSAHLSWDELLEALTDDIETRLEDTLSDLQAENVVRYSGRNGGYTLVTDELD